MKSFSFLKRFLIGILCLIITVSSCVLGSSENVDKKPIISSIILNHPKPVINQTMTISVVTDLQATKIKLVNQEYTTYIADINQGFADYIDTPTQRLWQINKTAQVLGENAINVYVGNSKGYSPQGYSLKYTVYNNEFTALNSPVITTQVQETTQNIDYESENLPKLDGSKINVLDNSHFVNGYIGYSGEIVPNSDYTTTAYIPVLQNEFYTLPASGDRAVSYYDKDKNFLERKQIDFGAGGITTIKVIENSDVAFMRVQFGYENPNGFNPENAMICYGNIYFDSYVEYGVNGEWLNSSKYNLNPLYNKKISWIGDSILAATNPDALGSLERIAIANNMEYKNCAVNGASISRTSNPLRACCIELADNLPKNSDYIIVGAGLNDAWQNCELGVYNESFDYDFDITTFYGALDELFYNLSVDFAGKKIGIIISHKTKAVPSQGIYVEALRQMCEKYSLPYLDLYKSSGLCGDIEELNKLYFLDEDYVHPNDLGYEMLKNKIEFFLKSL